jgi:hypothetical protein
MSGKILKHDSVRSRINQSTGEMELIESTKIARLDAEPPYAKLYTQDLAALHRLSPALGNLLQELAARMDYQNQIGLTPLLKKQIMAEINLKTDGSLRNAITKLSKAKLIRSLDRGTYEVNPYFFAKGRWSDISKRRKNFMLQLEYSPQGRKISSRSIPPIALTVIDGDSHTQQDLLEAE